MFAPMPKARRQHGDDCESGALAERAEGVADVLDDLVEPAPRPHGSHVLLRARHVAERATRGVSRVRFGHPVRDTLFGLEIEVCPDLAFDLVVSILLHGSLAAADPHTGLSTRAIARTSSSHRLCSMVSCFRPLAVSRYIRISRPRSVCSHFDVMQPLFSRRCRAG